MRFLPETSQNSTEEETLSAQWKGIGRHCIVGAVTQLKQRCWKGNNEAHSVHREAIEFHTARTEYLDTQRAAPWLHGNHILQALDSREWQLPDSSALLFLTQSDQRQILDFSNKLWFLGQTLTKLLWLFLVTKAKQWMLFPCSYIAQPTHTLWYNYSIVVEAGGYHTKTSLEYRLCKGFSQASSHTHTQHYIGCLPLTKAPLWLSEDFKLVHDVYFITSQGPWHMWI